MTRKLWVVLFAFSLGSAAQTVVPVTTRAFDNGRSGWNAQETLLTQASVRQKGIVRITTIPVVGDARGEEAQPLILPGVKLADGSTHDLLVLPSMADVVRGVDAHTGAGLWQVTLGTPIQGSGAIDFHLINDKWGCLSTGVIDPDTQRLYQVCWVSPDNSGAPRTARYYMFVLNLADGSLVTPAVLIQGKDGVNDFNSAMRKGRSSAVLLRQNGTKTVIQCSGTVQETGGGAAGFCFAFDVATNAITAMMATTQGEGGGIWMAGQGVAADPEGYLYAITGNGDFDGVAQFGESFIKMRYTPPAAGKPATLKVVDHWTPWTDLVRSGQRQVPTGKLAGMSMPTEDVKPVGGGMSMSLKNARLVPTISDEGTPGVLVYPMANGAWSDEDWGSAGPACLFAIGVCVATGKDGIGYPIKTSNLGGTTVADLANPKTNCAKLASAPAWLTMSPGPVDPCPQDAKTLDFLPRGVTAHLHMTPVQFFDPVLKSWTIFVWGENNQLHKWAVSSTGKLTYVAQSNEYASADIRSRPPGGMPGGFCSGSSNGSDPTSALLVCAIPYGDANAYVTNARILVYDPVHLNADGTLQVLWDSQRWGWQITFNKFCPPIIDGGEIIYPNYSGGVELLGLGQ